MKNRFSSMILLSILLGYANVVVAKWPGDCWVVLNQFDSEVIIWDAPKSHQQPLATWSFDAEFGWDLPG